MLKEKSAKEIEALLFDEEKENNTQQELKSANERLLRKRQLSIDSEELESVPYYKRPLVAGAFWLIIIVPCGWLLLSVFFPGSPPSSSNNQEKDSEKKLLKKSLEEERKKNQQLSIEKGLRTQQIEIVPVENESTSAPPPPTKSAQASTATQAQKPSQPEPAPAPRPAPRTIASPAPRPAPQPVVYTPAPRPQPSPATPRVDKPQVVPEPEPDPMEQWLAQANRGHYIAQGDTPYRPAVQNVSYTTPNPSPVAYAAPNPTAPASSPPERQLPTITIPTPVPLDSSASNPIEAPRPASTYGVETEQILDIGSSAESVLETGIAWTEQGIPPNRQYLLRLKEAFTNTEGVEVLPEDTRLIAQISETSNSGLFFMEVTAIVGDNGERILVTPGVLQIVAEDGSPLKADLKQKGGPGFWDNFGAIAAPGVERAFESIADSADSLLVNDGDRSIVRTSGSGDNPRAAGISGVASGASDVFSSQLESRRTEKAVPYFQFESGKNVRIMVYEDFSLPIREVY